MVVASYVSKSGLDRKKNVTNAYRWAVYMLQTIKKDWMEGDQFFLVEQCGEAWSSRDSAEKCGDMCGEVCF